jgi:hypothetical protein
MEYGRAEGRVARFENPWQDEGSIISTHMPENRRPFCDDGAVARILHLIATTPNKRTTRQAGDLEGHYDYWFDGGACRIVTGHTDYIFLDGTRARRIVCPEFPLDIWFPDGSLAKIHWEPASPLGEAQ